VTGLAAGDVALMGEAGFSYEVAGSLMLDSAQERPSARYLGWEGVYIPFPAEPRRGLAWDHKESDGYLEAQRAGAKYKWHRVEEPRETN
jgi:hypothetical protein